MLVLLSSSHIHSKGVAMKGYVVQLKLTNEFLNFQGLAVGSINHAIVFSSEDDAIVVARSQEGDTVVLPHEYTPTEGRIGTYYDYHRSF
jgi:hypothetical protein